MKNLLALLLSPFSFIYGLGVSIYQSLFFSGFFKSTSFSFPIIGIGNLSVGGTGKSPHIEYLIRFLSPYIKLAVLSRGYKRKTSGFKLVDEESNALEVGDEPKQMKTKFPDIPVAVSESRVLAIPKLIGQYPDLKLILLDDAFQHLEVKPSLQILLTEYSNPYFNDFLLPSGRLREWRFGSRRADIVIVTKCTAKPGESEIKDWRNKLKLSPSQLLFFSTIEYGSAYNILNPEEKFLFNPTVHISLISAIAQSDYLSHYVSDKVGSINEFHFEDHHLFTPIELSDIFTRHNANNSSNKIILTTEKDATRLLLHTELIEKYHVRVFAIPIEVKFYQQEFFEEAIKQHLLQYKI